MDVNVRKFLYLSTHTHTHGSTNVTASCDPPPSDTHLCRSKARTVPSREALTTTTPLEVKATALTLLVCSLKVMKQRPLVAFHTFT